MPNDILMEYRNSGYLIFWINAAIESLYAISTTAHWCPNFDVLFPWVPKVEAAMGWFPLSEIGLSKAIGILNQFNEITYDKA